MNTKKTTNDNIIWILIYTKAKQEHLAESNLNKQGFKTFLPLISPSNKDKCTKAPVPVFPRYLFAEINLDLENWTSINSTYGVNKIIMFSAKFPYIPLKIIKLIEEKLDKSGIYKENISFVDFKQGDSVSIKEGKFAGLDAIFLSKKSNDRVRLLLKFLNSSVVAEITKSDLGNKEIVKNFKF